MGQSTIHARTYSLPIDDIDTDQIFPAEFLTTTGREGLGRYGFYYWRFDSEGEPLADSPLAQFEPGVHQVLVTGRNFGCGSSREHAPWALLDMGVRAVVSSNFADIFHANALKNGLLPVSLDAEAVDFLLQNPGLAVDIDIRSTTIDIEGLGVRNFPLDTFAAHCLTEGIDQMEFLLLQDELIRDFERKRVNHHQAQSD